MTTADLTLLAVLLAPFGLVLVAAFFALVLSSQITREEERRQGRLL